MEASLKNKIFDDIKKNGYLTELNVGEKFRKKGWRVQYNQAYLDQDLNKSREIDLVAIYSIPTKTVSAAWVSIHLAIETKKSERPWVVFCSPKDNYAEDLSLHFNSTIRNNFSFPLLNKEAKGYIRNKIPFRGRNYYEAFKSYNETSKIYEAVLSSSKAARYLKEKEDEYYKNTELDFKFNEPITIKIFLPLIILDGQLVKAIIDNNGEPQLDDADYIPIVAYYHDNKGYEVTLSPDLITFKYLDGYVASIEKWIGILTKKIENGRESLWKEFMKSNQENTQ